MSNVPDAPTPDPDPDPSKLDPATLKDALGRTGRMLKQAGLPFEDDEFDDDAESEESDDSSE